MYPPFFLFIAINYLYLVYSDKLNVSTAFRWVPPQTRLSCFIHCRSFLVLLRANLARSPKVRPALQGVARALNIVPIVRHSLFAVRQFQIDRHNEPLHIFIEQDYSRFNVAMTGVLYRCKVNIYGISIKGHLANKSTLIYLLGQKRQKTSVLLIMNDTLVLDIFLGSCPINSLSFYAVL